MLRKRIIFILVLGLLAIATTSYATGEGVMTGDNIRLRTKPSTKNSTVLTLIEKNEKVEILAEEGKWYKVIYKEEEGYVSKQYVKVTKEIETSKETNPKDEEPEDNKSNENEGTSSENEEKPSEKENPQASSNTNVEIKTPADGVIKVDSTLSILPLIHSTSISSVKVGTNVKVTECKNGWAYVVVSSRISGWIRADKLNTENAKTTSEVQENKKDSNSEENKTTNKTNNTTRTTNTSQNTDKERNATNVTSRSSSSRDQVSKEEKTTDKKESASLDEGEEIAEYAQKYKGYKYVSGGSSPSTGFDCSGLTYYIYKHFGYKIARTASAQANYGTTVAKKDLQPGDLVLFSRGSYKIGHSGIYIGNNKFIHAANPDKGVVITSLSNEYYAENYVTARRLTK